jgi:hypothetical protein
VREAFSVSSGEGRGQPEAGSQPAKVDPAGDVNPVPEDAYPAGDQPAETNIAGAQARMSPTLRDLGAMAVGAVIWWLIFKVPWMAQILRGGSFLLLPLIPLVVVISGLVSMMATNYRFLAAELAWVIGLMLSIGLPPDVTGPDRTLALRLLLSAGAWFGLIYSPLILVGVWLVDKLRGTNA